MQLLHYPVVLAGISERLYTGFTGAENWLVFPDVQPALQQMKAAGVLLGAISNFDERLSELSIPTERPEKRFTLLGIQSTQVLFLPVLILPSTLTLSWPPQK